MIGSYAQLYNSEQQSFSWLSRFSKTKCVKKSFAFISLQKCLLSTNVFSQIRLEKMGKDQVCKFYMSICSANSAPGGMQQCSWGPRACTPRRLLQPPQTQWAGQPCCARSHPGTWGGQRFERSNLYKCLLWSVLRDPAQPTFHNVMPIQELLLYRSFHPDLRNFF